MSAHGCYIQSLASAVALRPWALNHWSDSSESPVICSETRIIGQDSIEFKRGILPLNEVIYLPTWIKSNDQIRTDSSNLAKGACAFSSVLTYLLGGYCTAVVLLELNHSIDFLFWWVRLLYFHVWEPFRGKWCRAVINVKVWLRNN